jgi:hypothetical protein
VNAAPGLWGHETKVLQYTVLEILIRDKHSSLLAPFTSNEENEVLSIRLLASGSIKLECYIKLCKKVLSGTNTLAYWVHSKDMKKIEC